MSTKVQLKSNNFQSFGGIFYVMDILKHLSFDKVIDNHLGLRSTSFGYQHSEIIQSFFIFFFVAATTLNEIITITLENKIQLFEERKVRTLWDDEKEKLQQNKTPARIAEILQKKRKTRNTEKYKISSLTLERLKTRLMSHCINEL